jgi:regulator of nonsense transcripts 2
MYNAGGFAVTIADPSAKFAEHLSKDWHETPWEDEECKSFYTDIPDLLNFVPRIYLVDEVKQLKKKRIRGNRKRQDDDLDDDFMENVDQELLDSVESTIEREDAESAAVNTKQASVITPIDAFNQRLPNLISQKLVDEAAVEFCHLRHGSPAIAQSKLIQTIVDVPRHRIDLLPYYARLLANLYPFIPEIGNTVVACLHSEFRRRFRKQTQFHLEHRIKNVRFLGELVKFRICATHIIFYCFKRLTQPESSGGSFDSSNAEVACALLDACGRYMLKIPEISIKFSPLVCT